MMLSTTKKIENNIRTLTEGIIMAEKKSFVCYKDTLVHLELLTYEQRGKLFTAMLQHENNLEILKLDDQTAVAFSFIKLQLERDDKNGNRLLSDVLKQVQKAGKRVLNLDGRRPKSMMRIKHLNKLIRMYLSLSPQTGSVTHSVAISVLSCQLPTMRTLFRNSVRTR